MSRYPVDGRSIDQGGSFAYEAECQDCENRLDLHQPDPLQPDRLLGICPCCKTWFLIDVAIGGQLFLHKLPEPPPRSPIG